jgi:hypothetical protein
MQRPSHFFSKLVRVLPGTPEMPDHTDVAQEPAGPFRNFRDDEINRDLNSGISRRCYDYPYGSSRQTN